MSLESDLQANTIELRATSAALNALIGLLSPANIHKSPALPTEDEDPPAAAAPEGAAIDYSAVKSKILELSVKKGKDVTRSLLAEFKVTTGLSLTPDQYQPVIDRINAVLESN